MASIVSEQYLCLASPQQIPSASRRDGEAKPHWGQSLCGGCLAFNFFGFSPYPISSAVAGRSRHPEAGEWAARERPQAVSTACAGPPQPCLPTVASDALWLPAACCRLLCTHLLPHLTCRVVRVLHSPLHPPSCWLLCLLWGEWPSTPGKGSSLQMISEQVTQVTSAEAWAVTPWALASWESGPHTAAGLSETGHPCSWKKKGAVGGKRQPRLLCCSVPLPTLWEAPGPGPWCAARTWGVPEGAQPPPHWPSLSRCSSRALSASSGSTSHGSAQAAGSQSKRPLVGTFPWTGATPSPDHVIQSLSVTGTGCDRRTHCQTPRTQKQQRRGRMRTPLRW